MGVGGGGLGSNRRRQASGVLRDTQAAGQGQTEPPEQALSRDAAAQPLGRCPPVTPSRPQSGGSDSYRVATSQDKNDDKGSPKKAKGTKDRRDLDDLKKEVAMVSPTLCARPEQAPPRMTPPRPRHLPNSPTKDHFLLKLYTCYSFSFPGKSKGSI